MWRAADRADGGSRRSVRSPSRAPGRSPRAASDTSFSRAPRRRRAGRSRPARPRRCSFSRTAARPLPTGPTRHFSPPRCEAGAVVLDNRVVIGARAGQRVRPRPHRGARYSLLARASWQRAPGPVSCSQAVEIELPVVPTRETITYFRVPDPLGLPPVIDDAVPDAAEHGLRRPGLINYALAAPGDRAQGGPPSRRAPRPTRTSPAPPTRRSFAGCRPGRRGRYPELDPEPVATETCIYTNTADESFVLERHGRVVVASACSGHGFKFAPAFGRTIAALARDAAS